MKLTKTEAIDHIKKYVKCEPYLKRAPKGEYICPWCGSGTGNSKTGALHYYEKDNRVHCFASCGKQYDIIDLVAQVEGIEDFNEAVNFICKENNIEIVSRSTGSPIVDDKPKEVENTDDEPKIDYSTSYKKWADNLTASPGEAYLKKRRIPLELAERYGLGYDHATKRVIIPLSKNSYCARSVTNNPDYPKMLNYGKVALFNAPALEHDIVFITEGCFDSMSIEAVGGHSIALGGSTHTKNITDIVDSNTKNTFIICMDDDEAGRKAEKKLIEDFSEKGIKYIVYDLCGSDYDANELLVNSRELLEENVKKAIAEARKDELDKFLDLINGDAFKPLATGLSFIDDLLCGGLLPQTLTVLLAPPALGKSTLVAQIGESLALNGHKVLYFNLEMSREQMLARAISSRLSRKGHILTATQILQMYDRTEEERKLIRETIEEYRVDALPFIKYNPIEMTNNLDRIKGRLEEAGKESIESGTDAPVVILDYLHLVSMAGAKDAQEAIKGTLKVLKDYGMKYKAPVIAISASNRDSNSRGKMTLESGRDSSALEYTADTVLSLNLWEIEQGEKNADISELLSRTNRNMVLKVLKSRFSPAGKTKDLYFNTACSIFYDGYGWHPVGEYYHPFGKDTKRKPM